jgi:putative ABC transport system permease protein
VAPGFVFRLARREIRGAWRQFAGLVVCVALGVAALVAVGTFGANLQRGLLREGKALLGGDLELRSSRPFDADAEGRLAEFVAAGGSVTHVRELASMARAAGGSALLVELKAVGAGYPLYGKLETTPERPLATLLAGRGALVDARLLERLGVRIGDRLQIGDTTVTITGQVVREPDRSGNLLTLGPRVFVSDATLDASALIGLGSRVRYRALVRLPEGRVARAARQALSRRLEDPVVRVVSFDQAQPGLRRFFTQLDTYLGLIALATLFVGGVGVGAAVRTFVRRRRDTIAILKTLGASSRLLVAGYLVQAAALGLAGSVLGAVLGMALQPLVARLLTDVLPFTVDSRPHLGTVARALALGGLTTVLTALWPLLEVRTVPPSLLLRRDVDTRRADRRRWLAVVPIAGGLAALVAWQAGNVRVAAIFIGATVAALALLAGMARALIGAARRAPRVPSLAWRQGLANLARPGGHAAGVVVALGIGVMLLVAVGLLETNLGRQLDHERRREVPSFFFVDIQSDQRDRFVALAHDVARVDPSLTPVVRARLAAVNGEAVTRELITRRRTVGDAVFYFTRDYALTSTTSLPEANVVTRGRWWSPGEAFAKPRASIEENAAKHLGLTVGSTVVFDVQGVPIEAEVASIRKVDWQTFSTNFMVLLSPGSLEGAPETFIATARVPPAAEVPLQNAIAAAMPNVTAVAVRDILERADAVLSRVAFAVRAIALLAVAVGLAVMAGALTASRYQRLVESVILRTLGATRGVVARIFAVEYACLGAAAGLGGSALAVVLAWVVVRYVLDTPWSLDPVLPALGVGLAITVAVGVGFLATFRLLGQKPLPVLRRE